MSVLFLFSSITLSALSLVNSACFVLASSTPSKSSSQLRVLLLFPIVLYFRFVALHSVILLIVPLLLTLHILHSHYLELSLCHSFLLILQLKSRCRFLLYSLNNLRTSVFQFQEHSLHILLLTPGLTPHSNLATLWYCSYFGFHVEVCGSPNFSVLHLPSVNRFPSLAYQ